MSILSIPFDNSYARLPEGLFARQTPTPVSTPRLLAFNDHLAGTLGISRGDDDDALAALLAGNGLPQGADPIAQLYGGHQFGNWNPQLGDGRALLLGEVATNAGRFDIQLKGSGPTPFSRRGDGRSWLGPVLREYVVSEAMHALGVPTTRALAAVATGEMVQRERLLPGGVMTRVASSHIRVGTFQILAAKQEYALLEALFEHAVERHYPDATDPLDFLNAVIGRQARLVARWMSLGFIHGVMNTDNCAISGETIDYGPCAFMDEYHPMTVFSSIDRRGRYAFAAQAQIIVWNMAQLATALVPLMPDVDDAVERFTQAVNAMPAQIDAAWISLMAAKIGITQTREGDSELVQRLLTLMAQDGADFTNSFRSLSGDNAQDQFADRDAFEHWARDWRLRIEDEPDPKERMRTANPAFIPRNHRIEEMIQAAVAGDMAPFQRLMKVLARPYDDQPEDADLARPPAHSERVLQTFCGT